MDITKLDQPTAELVQRGLESLGYNTGGTFRGVPGPLTLKAYHAFLSSKGKEVKGKTVSQLLVEILSAETGVVEVPRNSNKGPRVQEYQAATWLAGTGWAWCAAFICWGIMKAGNQIKLPFARPQTAGAWDFENWATSQKSKGVKLIKPLGSNKIKAGDIVVFTFSHIGLAIEDEKSGKVKTVEGNTDGEGTREGNGVYIKTRANTTIRSIIRLP